MQPTLTTPRLRLEPVAPHHAADLFAVYSRADALRYWYAPPHQTPAETEKMVADQIRHGGDHWTVMHIESGRAIGQVNIINALVPGMGYIIHPDFWRQGYGTEAFRAALDYAFQTRGFDRIELWIDKENIASQKLGYKLGFFPRCQFYQRYDHHPHPREFLVFGLRREEWAIQQGNTPPFDAMQTAILSVQPVIPVKNVSETVAFYRNRLGFNVDYTQGFPMNFAIVSRGEWSFQRATLHFVEEPQPATGTLYLQISAPVDRLYEEFRAKNVTIIEAPVTRDYGRRDFTIEDHNGWRIRFASAV
jgi:ribosomal-protein-alanine N-acetyltransferase